MTSFNTAAVSMNLDEYFDHFVVPKPDIPKRYPGFTGQKKNRQAAHLQSYKDTPDDDEDEIEEEKISSIADEFNSSIQDSNNNQIDYETNDFNQLYEDANSQKEGEKNRNPPPTETSMGSQANNVNQPPGAAPSVSNQRQNIVSNGRGNRNRNRQRYVPFNNDRNRIPVQQRLGYNNQLRNSQREHFPMRNGLNICNNNNNYIGSSSNAFDHLDNNLNAFNNNNNNRNEFINNINNNNGNYNPHIWSPVNNNNVNNNNFNNASNRVSMNSSNDFLNSLQVAIENPNLMRFNNSNDNQYNNSLKRNFASSNSLTSLITSANQMVNINKNNNNVHARLGSQLRGLTANEFSLGNQERCNDIFPQRDNQKNVVNNSLRLADLMNMDRNSCVNMNVAEVAKNAIMLLSAYKPNPQSNNFQQPIPEIQQNNIYPPEPQGTDVNINSDMSDMRMYHRFN